jgi:hypothetical protein
VNTELHTEPAGEGLYFKGLAAGPGIGRDEAVELIRRVHEGDASITVTVSTGDGRTRPLEFRPIQMLFCG